MNKKQARYQCSEMFGDKIDMLYGTRSGQCFLVIYDKATKKEYRVQGRGYRQLLERAAALSVFLKSLEHMTDESGSYWREAARHIDTTGIVSRPLRLDGW